MPHSTTPRPGFEVFVDQAGTITIQQQARPHEDPASVTVDPEDVPFLIELLENARVEALSGRPDDADPTKPRRRTTF
jgi:hypothetical protein